MAFQPNRPVRVGTEMKMTDAKGNLPKAQNSAADSDADKASDSMTKAELIDMAKREGVDVETDDNKADLVRKINRK